MKSSSLSILFLLFFIFSCQIDARDNENEISINLNDVKSITEVNTVLAQKEDFEYFVNVQGKIEPLKEIQIHFRATGTVRKLNFANGEKVRKGHVVFEIENNEQVLILQTAEAELQKQIAGFKTKLIEFGIDTVKDNKTSEQKIDYIRIMSGLAAAEINVKQAQLALNYTIIKSPISGTIADLKIKEGNVVQKGDYCCTIYSADYLILNTSILETDFEKINIGQVAEVYSIAKANNAYQAKVMEINPKVEGNGMVSIKLKLLETTGLLPGMNANAIIKVPYNRNIIVPKEALIIRSGKEVVFTVEDGLAKWHYVTTGMDNGEVVEIMEGLEEDSYVIISNNLQLAHGAPVKVMK